MCYFRFDYHICATQTVPELECTARMVSLRIFKWNFKSHPCWIQYLNAYTHSTAIIAVYIKVFTTFRDGKFKYLRNSNDLKVYAYCVCIIYIYIYIYGYDGLLRWRMLPVIGYMLSTKVWVRWNRIKNILPIVYFIYSLYHSIFFRHSGV